MSNVAGSVLGVVRAAFGLGQGAIQVKDSKSIEEDSSYVTGMYDKAKQSVDDRKKHAQKFVDSYYNIATDFYETGWGQSFHFAPRGRSETFRESIIRHEHYLALKLNIQPDDVVLDVGCGIGGPMRNIAQFTGANITGVTINEYQVNRGNEINRNQGFGKQCVLQQGDFCKLDKFADNSFDKVFAIESTCHAPDRCDVYDQIYRVLKPGGLFAVYEWVLNDDTYDASNANHVHIKYQIEKGNALPDLITDKECISFFKQSGFEILHQEDLDRTSREKGQTPWHASLMAKCSLETMQHTYFGVLFTHCLTWLLETVRVAPKGTFQAHEILSVARDGLVKGGQTQVFTPMLMIVGKKPQQISI